MVFLFWLYSKVSGNYKTFIRVLSGYSHCCKKCSDEWEISDQIVGMSFDTTSSNTGVRLGACTLLEAELNRNLLQFASRHYITLKL